MKGEFHPVLASFREVSRTIRHLLQLYSDENGLSVLQLMILDALSRGGQMSVSELADNLQLSPSAISVTAEQLVKMDMLERVRCEGDRRTVRLSLSEKGNAKIEAFHHPDSHVQKRLSRIMDLPPEDLQALLRIHNQILHQLTTEED